MINPLAGLDPAEMIDMRPVAAELEALLASDQALEALPAKFGFVLDGGGGRLPLTDLAADVRLAACYRDGRARVALGMAAMDGVAWLGTTDAADAPAKAVQLARLVLQYSPTRRSATLPSTMQTALSAALGLTDSNAIATR
ncbi:MAG: precorrin-3B synthase, partial [Bradyrhizobium sp.]